MFLRMWYTVRKRRTAPRRFRFPLPPSSLLLTLVPPVAVPLAGSWPMSIYPLPIWPGFLMTPWLIWRCTWRMHELERPCVCMCVTCFSGSPAPHNTSARFVSSSQHSSVPLASVVSLIRSFWGVSWRLPCCCLYACERGRNVAQMFAVSAWLLDCVCTWLRHGRSLTRGTTLKSSESMTWYCYFFLLKPWFLF